MAFTVVPVTVEDAEEIVASSAGIEDEDPTFEAEGEENEVEEEFEFPAGTEEEDEEEGRLGMENGREYPDPDLLLS